MRKDWRYNCLMRFPDKVHNSRTTVYQLRLNCAQILNINLLRLHLLPHPSFAKLKMQTVLLFSIFSFLTHFQFRFDNQLTRIATKFLIIFKNKNQIKCIKNWFSCFHVIHNWNALVLHQNTIKSNFNKKVHSKCVTPFYNWPQINHLLNTLVLYFFSCCFLHLPIK